MRYVAWCSLVLVLSLTTGCDDESDPCEGIDCSGFGECVVENYEPRCECDEGYVAHFPECVPDSADGDADGDSDGDGDGDADGDSDGDADGDGDSDADGDGDTDSDSDSDSEADEEVEGDADEEVEGDAEVEPPICIEGDDRPCESDMGRCGGIQFCSGEDWGDCVGGVPAGEVRACGSDEGECRPGVQICLESGDWSECRGVDHVPPSAETCDDTDEDCDGAIDNCNPLSEDELCDDDNGCGGICELDHPPGEPCDGPDTDLCQDDEYECTDLNETVCSTGEESVEICNDIDDDCDGEVDEGENACGGLCELDAVPGEACDGPDADECDDDEYECFDLNDVVCSTGEDNAEECNGEDDDCDGEIDEDCAPLPNAVARFPWNGYTTGSVHATAAALKVRPLRPTFRWEKTVGATDYELQVDDSCTTPGFTKCAFPSPAISEVVKGTSFTPPADMSVSKTVPVGRRYYWRVRAHNSAGYSEWTAVRYVDVGRMAQDFNGDGYSDAIVGAPYQDRGATDEGNAFVYYGTPTGLPVSPPRTLDNPDNQAGGHFGCSVASAGDVNGDGFDDAIVGAYSQDHIAVNEGSAFVYHGSADGLPELFAQRLDNPAHQATGYFGASVASAGDVNGDGFADVIVGAYAQDWGAIDEGNSFLYHGSAAGLPSDPSLQLDSPDNHGSGYFGTSVASAGDVNGDGFVDVIVGAPQRTHRCGWPSGCAFVYYGSFSGLPASESVRYCNGCILNGNFGKSVASAGDVNGDGFADAIVGASGQASYTGQAFVYYGSAAGLPSSHNLLLDNPDDQPESYFGYSVASAGDVNNDGFDDVIIGAFQQENHGADTDEGNAFVYYGSTDGLPDLPPVLLDNPDDQASGYFGWSVASTGDVNGDGYSDVIVGAWHQYHGAGDEGNAFVYHGSAGGLHEPFDLRLDNPNNQANSSFGYSVAWLDDRGQEDALGRAVAGLLRRLLPGMG